MTLLGLMIRLNIVCIEFLRLFGIEHEIAVLVLHNKLKKKDVEFPPEIRRYYPALEIEDMWIKYPWDAEDIEEHTAKEKEMFEELRRQGKEDMLNGII